MLLEWRFLSPPWAPSVFNAADRIKRIISGFILDRYDSISGRAFSYIHQIPIFIRRRSVVNPQIGIVSLSLKSDIAGLALIHTGSYKGHARRIVASMVCSPPIGRIQINRLISIQVRQLFRLAFRRDMPPAGADALNIARHRGARSVITCAPAVVQRSLPAVQAPEGYAFARVIAIAAVVPYKDGVFRRIRKVQVFRHPGTPRYIQRPVRLSIARVRHFAITYRRIEEHRLVERTRRFLARGTFAARRTPAT